MLTPPDAPLYRFQPPATARPEVSGRRWAVAAAHHLAAAAAARILAAGGNATDAGVAAALCINVVQPDEATFGGVAPMIIYNAANREVLTISGLGRWPRGVDPGRLRGAAGGRMPLGVLRCVTPAAPDAYLAALARSGSMRFAEVAAPASELAGGGFPVDRYLAANLAAAAPVLSRWPSSAAIFLPGGRPPGEGETLLQADLAETFRTIAAAERAAAGDRQAGLRAARDCFYSGPIARRIARFMADEGGFLTADDLTAFRVGVEPPVRVAYRGHEALACGAWCQGPALLQALRILEGYDLAAMDPQGPAYLHLLIEALKCAFADRHAYYGDPDSVDVPLAALLSPERGAGWRARIDPARALPGMPVPAEIAGYRAYRDPAVFMPDGAGPLPQHPDTSYVCVVDAEGNAFSATPSDGIQYTPVVPGLGFVVSGRGDQSWLDPAHPSGVAPWKRPRLTPCPGMVLREGQPWLVYGTPGGDVQPQAMLQTLLNMVIFGMSPQRAIEAPRLATFSHPDSFDPHLAQPGLVRAESRLPEASLEALARLGHRAERWPDWIAASGAVCAIEVDRARGALRVGADPRRLANAIAW